MVFSLHNQNEIFLKHALRTSVFGQNYFGERIVVDEILYLLESKAKTELVLNCLSFADFSSLRQEDLSAIIDFIAEMTSNEPVEQNRILLAYNPI